MSQYAHSRKEIPNTEHWAALVFDSIYIPGDQRSIDCPGHGYPSHNAQTLSYIVFKDEAERDRWVDQRGDAKDYKIIKSRGFETETKTTVRLVHTQ